jgi:hypothetical protein
MVHIPLKLEGVLFGCSHVFMTVIGSSRANVPKLRPMLDGNLSL